MLEPGLQDKQNRFPTSFLFIPYFLPDWGTSGAFQEDAHWKTHKGATSTAGKDCSVVCRAVVLPQDQCVQDSLKAFHRHTRVGAYLQNTQLRLLFCLFTATS